MQDDMNYWKVHERFRSFRLPLALAFALLTIIFYAQGQAQAASSPFPIADIVTNVLPACYDQEHIDLKPAMVVKVKFPNNDIEPLLSIAFFLRDSVTTQPIGAFCVNARKAYDFSVDYCAIEETVTSPQVAWLLANYPPLEQTPPGCGNTSCSARIQNTARQLAVWHLTDGTDPIGPSNPADLADYTNYVKPAYDAILAALATAEQAGLPAAETVVYGAAENSADAQRVAGATAALGDFVWSDLNSNGKQDVNEPGVNGVTVHLFVDSDADNIPDTEIGSMTTAHENGHDGYYKFGGLIPGVAYKVTFDLPSGFTGFTARKASGVANDVNSDGPTSDIVTLANGEFNSSIDAGLLSPRFSLGDRVWYDQDQDGIQDANEPGYNGASVQLYNNATCTGSPLATTTTAAGPTGFGNGYYNFDNLLAGSYCVQFGNLPPTWSISPSNQGNGTNDSSANSSAQIPNISLTADDPDEDIGIFVPGTLGDDVRCITTGAPLANITVTLFKDFDANGVADGPALATTTTNASGFYQFTGLQVALAGGVPANTTHYIVRVDTNDADLGTCNVPVPPTEYNPPLDSDEPNDPTNDFQFKEPDRYSLGDRVWYDQDQDGIQDANEPGYNGASVQLYNNATCTGSPLATTTTAAGPTGFGNGYYNFDNLLAGSYCVQFGNLPPTWSISPSNQGNGTNDSSANSSAQIPNISLTADDPDEDMGIFVPGTLGDDVRCITTGAPLANITVTLFKDFDANGVADGPALATTTTNASGFYQFTGLQVALAGGVPANTTQYIVRVDTNDADLGTCNVPVPPTEYNPPLDSDKPNDPKNDFEFKEPLACGLVLDKKCVISVLTPTTFSCSDAKPINSLSMVWNGDQPVKIKAWKGAVGSTLLATIDNIQPGEIVNVTGYAGAPNDVYWEIFAAGSDTKLGQSTFHLSCSDSNMNGPEDCRLPQGDGKANNASLINKWLLEGMAGNGQSFLCTPPPADPQESCLVTAVPIPSCQVLKANGQRLTSVTFKYTGDGCNASDNTQDPSKAICSGSINGTLPVQVTNTNGYSIVPTTVGLGQEFTVSSDSFDSNSVLKLTNSGGTETNAVHTSCSQPFAVGDVFGSLTVTAINGEKGGADVSYIFTVKNLGDALTGVTVTDDKLGTVGGPFSLAKDETKTFETQTNIFATTTNVATAQGSLASGEACASPATSATVTVEEPCAVCKGGTTQLSLEYRGTTTVNVVVYDDGSVKQDKILFQGSVAPGDVILLSPLPGKDKLNNDVSIYVNGVLNTKLKTDCSDAIGPGLISGSFEVVEGHSKDNGRMCPLNTCEAAAAPALEFSGKEVKWEVTNNGDVGLEISRITINWPAGNGYLDEVKRDGDVFHKGNFNATSATIISGWEGDANKRTIKSGDTDTLKFKFQNDVVLTGAYSIVVEFTYGCSITITFEPGTGGTPGADFCETAPGSGKAKTLTMVYTGANCTSNCNEQDASKAIVTGNPANTSPVWILATPTGKSNKLFEGSVLQDGSFTLSAASAGISTLETNTTVNIYASQGGSLLSSVQFHTSCSQPLKDGDFFGSLKLTGFTR